MDKRLRVIRNAIAEHRHADKFNLIDINLNGHYRIRFKLANGVTDSISIACSPRANDGLPNYTRQAINRMLCRHGLA